MVRIAVETPSDLAEVETLYDLAFAPGREALSSYRLRDGAAPARDLCLVARDDYDTVVGAIRFWPVVIAQTGAVPGGEPPGGAGARRWPALLLGPIAVHPIRQGEGVGALLMLEGLERAAIAGWKRVALIGDAPYYRRFGFTAAADRLAFPPPTHPKRILARSLVEGGMDRVAGEVRAWPHPAPGPLGDPP